jgi:DNA-binding NarL/FixJ family response regulator
MTQHAVEPLGDTPAIFVADSNPFDCQLLCECLVRDHLRVIDWAVDSATVIAEITKQKPDVALISMRLQDGPRAGWGAARQIRSSQPDTRIVMLLDASDPELVVEAFRSGAIGVFSRTHLSSDLHQCIRSVLAGKIGAGHEEVLYVIEALRNSFSPHVYNSKGISLLTKREDEVVNLVVNNLTNREIAKEMHLSDHTVKNYMFDIFEKVGISTRVELVVCALNHNQYGKEIYLQTRRLCLGTAANNERQGERQARPEDRDRVRGITISMHPHTIISKRPEQNHDNGGDSRELLISEESTSIGLDSGEGER